MAQNQQPASGHKPSDTENDPPNITPVVQIISNVIYTLRLSTDGGYITERMTEHWQVPRKHRMNGKQQQEEKLLLFINMNEAKLRS